MKIETKDLTIRWEDKGRFARFDKFELEEIVSGLHLRVHRKSTSWSRKYKIRLLLNEATKQLNELKQKGN